MKKREIKYFNMLCHNKKIHFAFSNTDREYFKTKTEMLFSWNFYPQNLGQI